MDGLRIQVFGRFEALRSSGEKLEFPTVRAAELIARLVLTRTGQLSRQSLAQDLWPAQEPERQLTNLRPALHYALVAVGGHELERIGQLVCLKNWNSSDWRQAVKADALSHAAESDDQRLSLLLGLLELTRKPLLKSWTSDWIEPFRSEILVMRVTALVRAADIFRSRGELNTALQLSLQALEMKPLDETCCLQHLRILGGLGRTREARRFYEGLQATVKEEPDREVPSEVRSVAKRILSGSYSESGIPPISQQEAEAMRHMVGALVESEPGRIVGLFASPHANWSMVLHGIELRGLLESALNRTMGMGPERAAATKRLLQAFLQAGEFQKVRRWALRLLESECSADKVAALNYLAWAEESVGDVPQALSSYGSAIDHAIAAADLYLAAVSRANRAVAHYYIHDFEQAVEDFAASLPDLDAQEGSNGRLSAARARAGMALCLYLLGRTPDAQLAAAAWRVQAQMHGLSGLEPIGQAVCGLIAVREADREGVEAIATAIHEALAGRQRITQLAVAVIACHGVAASGARASNDLAASLKWRILDTYESLLPVHETALKLLDAQGPEPSEPGLSLAEVLLGLEDLLLSTRPQAAPNCRKS